KKVFTADWKAENAIKFELDDSLCKCPTCQTEYTPEVLEEKKEVWQANFNTEKKAKLQKIVDKADAANAEIDSLNAEIETLRKRISVGESQTASCNESLTDLISQVSDAEQIVLDLESGKEEKQPFEEVRDADKGYKDQLAVIAKLEA